MGVSAETATDPSIEMVTHRDFFAGGFGVKVHKYDVGLLLNVRQNPVNGVIGAVSGFHKQPTYQAYGGHDGAFAGFVNPNTSSGGELRQICRPGDVIRYFEGLDYVFFAVSVVA
jgi:hypothetical protein